jgi:hypothetical protein
LSEDEIEAMDAVERRREEIAERKLRLAEQREARLARRASGEDAGELGRPVVGAESGYQVAAVR